MKNTRTLLAGCMLMLATGFIGCNISPEKKAEDVDNAAVKLSEAEDALDKAKSDSALEYTRFKQETEMMLAANEEKMNILKEKMMVKKADLRTQYEKDLDRLKAENEKLRKDLNEFTYGTNENWEAFKSNVAKDIDRIGKSISEMAEKADKKQ
jgi:phosphopantetheine adenylyltransferase